MLENWGMLLFVLVALVFLGGFVLGTQWNVRKGNQILKWLRGGLTHIGDKSTLRWLGSSVIELKIAKAKSPFRAAETLIVFEPRDIVFLWVLARAQDRRDLLIFRAQLHEVPRFEIEVFNPKGWTTHNTERDVRRKDWTPLDLPADQPLRAYYSGNAGASAKPLIDLALRASDRLVRLSLHRDVPNLELHWRLPDPKTQSARDFFMDLRKLGEDATR
jgi:hypothetical protein